MVLDSSASQPNVAAVVNWLLSVEEADKPEEDESAGEGGDFGGEDEAAQRARCSRSVLSPISMFTDQQIRFPGTVQ